MLQTIKNLFSDIAFKVFYKRQFDLTEFWQEERKRRKLEILYRDCAILEEKIKEAKRRKQKSSHFEREFVSKKAELMRGGE